MKVKFAAVALVPLATIFLLHATLHAQPPSKSIWDGIYTEEQATRGEALYGEHCGKCHGATLQGNGEGALPLTGATFKSTWNGVAMGAMFDRVRLSMPQDKPATMTRQQVADLLAFILRANKFPAGTSELARQTDVLNAITFQADK